MKYFYITSLIVILSFSCVSKKRYEDIVNKNKKLNELIETTGVLSDEVKNLQFKIKNLEFNLQMCETKLRRQDRKLIECLKLRGRCND